MTISPTLHKYLAAENIEYDEIPHVLTMSSALTAQACHVPGDRLAKAVVLRRNGGYLLAVLPASHHLRLADLKASIGDDITMAAESEVDRLFADCAHGAVPPPASATGSTSSLMTASRCSPRSKSKPAIMRRCFISVVRNSHA